MYQSVIPSSGRKRPKSNLLLGILIAIVVVVLAICLYPPVRMMVHQSQYKAGPSVWI